MKSIKYLFLLVLFTGLMSGAAVNISAQGNKILATVGNQSLKQSDVQNAIDFFEWATQKEFTAEQRRQYEAIKAEQFQNNPTGTKKGLTDIGNMLAAVRGKAVTEQNELREKFNNNFVGELRNGNDAESRFMLSIYESGETSVSNETVAESNTEVGNISALVGKWVWSRTGSSGVNGNGVYIGSNGSRFTYQFYSNGAVEFTGIMNVMSGSCNQQIFRSVKGQASLSGSTLTIRWAPEKFTRDFSCDTGNNYTKTMPAKTDTLRISFKNDLGQKQMCIEGAECYSETR